METEISNKHLFPSLGPALMISMGYIDLGKWVAAVEAGSKFGSDLVLPVLFFNLFAILCQYLATCISMATGKNLAQICQDEYSKSTCMLLGAQAELSILTSKLTMVFGVAHAFNLLLGFDLITCICLAALATNILPFFITNLESKNGESAYVFIAGCALLSYVVGVLFSQPEIPLATNVMFPRVNAEDAYSLMALLGANVMAHNFYVHSSLVQSQNQRRNRVVAMGALFHDHFFVILFIFTMLFLVYFVLINSAALLSSTADILLNFQDAVLLMDQVYPMVPVVFLCVLLFSSQVITLTSNIGTDLISHHFFGLNLSHSTHHLALNFLTVVPAIYFAKTSGAEGIYQLFTLCQVIQAILLPSSVIPLFRIASSNILMGAFKISSYVEMCSFAAFLVMLSANIIFFTEMLLGNSGWMNGLKGNTGISVVIPYPVIILLSFVSIGFTLFLAVTPLKSASDEVANHGWLSTNQTNISQSSEISDISDRRMLESNLLEIETETERESTVCFEEEGDFVVEQEKSSYETASVKVHETRQETFDDSSAGTSPISSPVWIEEESKSIVETDWTDSNVIEKGNVIVHADPAGEANQITITQTERNIPSEPELQIPVPKETTEEKESGIEIPVSHPDLTKEKEQLEPVSINSFKDFDLGSGPASLSRISGLGRAARKQLSAILDEFWAHLFDFHGKLTQDASLKKLDVLLGLDLRIVGSTDKTGQNQNPINMNESIKNSVMRSNLDLSYGLNTGSTSWSQSMQLPPTSNGIMEQQQQQKINSLNYSNFNSPNYSDNQFYQPATIHGYQLASYLKGFNTGRNPYLPDPIQRAPKSPSPYASNGMSGLNESYQNLLGTTDLTSLQSSISSRINQLIAERNYLDSSLIEPTENLGGSSNNYAKKYHSSPDVSALIAASRKALLNEGNLGTGTIGPQPYLSRMASDRSQMYLGPISRSGTGTGTGLGLDELGPPRPQRDIYSLQSNPNPNLSPNTKSLWSKQPFEQFFPMTNTPSKGQDFSYADSEAKLLQSLRFCITKLIKLEGSSWLFSQDGGSDEDLIERVAESEWVILSEKDETGPDPTALPNCGDDCVWRAALVVSFGVWCIRRVLDLSLVESRPELWGKYTYVLNRLQGIVDPAFSKPRGPLNLCKCVQVPNKPMSLKSNFTTALTVLEMIKDVESSVSGRKGRSGTAAGDVAFPKGKENLASVLKRYKRRLTSNVKSAGGS
ncbi:hypothetical protein LUZ60_010293 [Juncus effusus]|nr:hypothetical protein LUZ60_010293 [Juncus effusus]